VTHQRVDHAHGDAYSVWVSQGSPATPSAAQLAELREAMVPVELSPQQEVAVVNGAVSLSLDLPRFGISLLTLSPPNAGGAEVSSASDASCSCRLSAAPQSERSVLLALSVLVALAYARRWSVQRAGADPLERR
jgi:hypothetical protein